MLPIV